VAFLGLALIPAIGLALILTGLPAFVVLIGAAAVGALAAAAFGDAASFLTALPSRIVTLLENDLLQALPLFVLMGALLNRLPLADVLFRTGVAAAGNRPAPKVAAIALGALLAPMNGSVGAGVAVLSRTVRPKLAAHGVPAADGFATIAVASTLGVVVPPSLVLILLGDAMMAAHTIASNAAGRSDRIVNTQDIFRGVVVPGGIFLALCLAIAAFAGRAREEGGREGQARACAADWAVSALTVAFIVILLGGVAAGRFYAVEAAAMGAVTLLAGGLLSGRLDKAALATVLTETLTVTGALFALLLAATTFTLVVRALGTDRLLAALIGAIPGGELGVTLAVLGTIAASAFVLDAFEIIFVIVPIVMPALLTRVPDAVWVAVLTTLTLQASFLLPPLGYAVMMTRGLMAEGLPTRLLVRALAPYLLAQAAVLALTAAYPGLTHLVASRETRVNAPVISDEEVRRQFEGLLPAAPGADAPPLGFDTPAR
jgi:tripartite ATP-independent transporter DctM subunit